MGCHFTPFSTPTGVDLEGKAPLDSDNLAKLCTIICRQYWTPNNLDFEKSRRVTHILIIKKVDYYLNITIEPKKLLTPVENS